MTFHRSPTSFVYTLRTADFSNAVCSPPGSSKRSDPVGVVYWQVRIRTLPSRKPSHHFSFLFEGPRNADVSFIFSSTHDDRRLTLLSRGPYDPLKVDVWSLGATTWELAHGDPPFSDVQDTRLIVGHQLPPVREPETLSRSFHDFLHLCSQPVASRPDPDELLNVRVFPPLFYFHFSHCLYFLRLILYGLHALARRLFGCWASVRQSTRSSYFARMMISIRKSKFSFFLGHSFLPFIYISLSSSSLRSHIVLSVLVDANWY